MRANDYDTTTATCPDCGSEHTRTRLDRVEKGGLACPECGSIVVMYSALKQGAGSHVVVPVTRSNHAVAHEPSDEHPLVPACDSYVLEDAAYKPVLERRLSDAYQECTDCNGTGEDPAENAAGETIAGQVTAQGRARAQDTEADY